MSYQKPPKHYHLGENGKIQTIKLLCPHSKEVRLSKKLPVGGPAAVVPVPPPPGRRPPQAVVVVPPAAAPEELGAVAVLQLSVLKRVTAP